MQYIAITIFTMMAWFMTFTFGSFAPTPSGIVGSIVTLAVFWITTEAVARMRDGPMYDLYEFLVNGLRELGAFVIFLLFWSVISVMVALAMMLLVQHFPDTFGPASEKVAAGWEALRRGYSVTMIFGVLYLMKYPIRPTTLLRHFGVIKKPKS